MAVAMSIDALRARISELEGARVVTRRSPSGLDVIDQLVGGLPQPGIVEVCGPEGSGRTRLALSLVRRQPHVAWVDYERCLYPPAVVEAGVDLSRMLLLQPPADRALWTVEQVLRAGCFPLVVASSPPPLRRAGQRWARAAEAGGSTLLVLRGRTHRDLPADVRLQVGSGRLSVVRNRGGRHGASVVLPPARSGIHPWG